MPELKGKLFNIQPYSIHDGPGIRTTFFLKGCPLSCKWCQNPESQSCKKQLLMTKNFCIGCGECQKNCSLGAVQIKNGIAVTDRRICNACGDCISCCPKEGRKICGAEYTVEELMKYALSDKIFYDGSNGGVTVSGGEVLSQSEFAAAFLEKCQEAGIHTAVDTSGFAPWEKAKMVFEHANLVLYDLKHMDSNRHKILTGVPNEQILENLKRLCELDAEIYIRIPIIPGMNDSKENIRATAEFVKTELTKECKSFLLPYHYMGESKLDSLEKTDGYLNLDPPSDKKMEQLKQIFDEMGLKCQIGG